MNYRTKIHRIYIDKMKDTRLENLYEGEFWGGTPSVAKLIEEGVPPFQKMFKELKSIKKHEKLGRNGDYL